MNQKTEQTHLANNVDTEVESFEVGHADKSSGAQLDNQVTTQVQKVQG